MSRRLLRFAAVILLLWATLGSAWAQRNEFAYLNAGAGWSALRYDCGFALSCQQGSVGGRLVGGLLLGPGFAAEVLLLDFGRAHARYSDRDDQVRQHMLGLGTAVQWELGGGLLASFRGGLAVSRVERTVAQLGRSRRDSTAYLDGYGGFSLLFRMTRGLALEIGFDATGVEDRVERDSAAMGFVGLSLRY